MSADSELRWGYTLADLQRVAGSAAATTRAMAGDYDDRYAEAFSAAAEQLYAAEHWIPEYQLFRAAQDALFEQSRKDRSYRGCAYKRRLQTCTRCQQLFCWSPAIGLCPYCDLSRRARVTIPFDKAKPCPPDCCPPGVA